MPINDFSLGCAYGLNRLGRAFFGGRKLDAQPTRAWVTPLQLADRLCVGIQIDLASDELAFLRGVLKVVVETVVCPSMLGPS